MYALLFLFFEIFSVTYIYENEFILLKRASYQSALSVSFIKVSCKPFISVIYKGFVHGFFIRVRNRFIQADIVFFTI